MILALPPADTHDSREPYPASSLPLSRSARTPASSSALLYFTERPLCHRPRHRYLVHPRPASGVSRSTIKTLSQSPREPLAPSCTIRLTAYKKVWQISRKPPLACSAGSSVAFWSSALSFASSRLMTTLLSVPVNLKGTL
jgi:hypothetical protein